MPLVKHIHGALKALNVTFLPLGGGRVSPLRSQLAQPFSLVTPSSVVDEVSQKVVRDHPAISGQYMY
ncbi:MAG: hypothetical protein Q9211_005597 [Gyalolechia sp. 1 TL-2023]